MADRWQWDMWKCGWSCGKGWDRGQRGGSGGSGDANWQSMGAIATGARALFNRMPVAMVVRSDCQEPVEP